MGRPMTEAEKCDLARIADLLVGVAADLEGMDFALACLGATFLSGVSIERACEQIRPEPGQDLIQDEIYVMLVAAKNLMRMVQEHPSKARQS